MPVVGKHQVERFPRVATGKLEAIYALLCAHQIAASETLLVQHRLGQIKHDALRRVIRLHRDPPETSAIRRFSNVGDAVVAICLLLILGRTVAGITERVRHATAGGRASTRSRRGKTLGMGMNGHASHCDEENKTKTAGEVHSVLLYAFKKPTDLSDAWRGQGVPADCAGC